MIYRCKWTENRGQRTTGKGRIEKALSIVHCPLSIIFSFFLVSCSHYSFVSGSVDESLKTIAIPLFEDRTQSGQPVLGETLTDYLTKRFVRQTRLRLLQDEYEADVVLRGYISQYGTQPAAVGSNEVATQNRVSIEVFIEYYNNKTQKSTFNRAFTQSLNFDATRLGEEAKAAKTVLDRISEDAFTAATSDW